MLRASVWGFFALAVTSLSSYAYQVLMVFHLPSRAYALVMVGIGSFLTLSYLGSALEVMTVLRKGSARAIDLALLMAMASAASTFLAWIGAVPLGPSVQLPVAAGISAAMTLPMSWALGIAQAEQAWGWFAIMVTTYSVVKAGLATVCYDPTLGVLIPGIAALLGSLPAFLIRRPPATLELREILTTAIKFAPLPLVANLDLWLAPHWLGSRAEGYGVPAVLARPFFYLAAGLAPAVRRGAASGCPKWQIAALAAIPLGTAPLGIAVLLEGRTFLPAPWNSFSTDLLLWAGVAQSAVGALLLAMNGFGPRAQWGWAAGLLFLPLALVIPPLAQIATALSCAGIMVIVSNVREKGRGL